jgi:hypothetical protein
MSTQEGHPVKWYVEFKGFALGPWESEDACRAWWRVDLFAFTHGKVVGR